MRTATFPDGRLSLTAEDGRTARPRRLSTYQVFSDGPRFQGDKSRFEISNTGSSLNWLVNVLAFTIKQAYWLVSAQRQSISGSAGIVSLCGSGQEWNWNLPTALNSGLTLENDSDYVCYGQWQAQGREAVTTFRESRR